MLFIYYFLLGEPLILESSTKDVEVDIGDSCDLHCIAQGYPTPTINWIRADSKALRAVLNGEVQEMAKYNVSNNLFIYSTK